MKFKIGDMVKWPGFLGDPCIITAIDNRWHEYAVLWDIDGSGEVVRRSIPIDKMDKHSSLLCPSGWFDFQERIQDRLKND